MFITDADVPCKQHDPKLWFSKSTTARTQKAKQLCLSCSERLPCLAGALRFEKKIGRTQLGTYGALTPEERAQISGQQAPDIIY